MQLSEGRLTFVFPEKWEALKHDSTKFYRKRFQSFAGGSPAVDLVAFDASGSELWLIEVKDYRTDRRTKAKDLFDEMAAKVSSTLSGLVAARANASDGSESFALRALTKISLRVVLCLEQPDKPSRLHPQVIDPKTAKLKMRQRLRPVDPHAVVGDKVSLNVLMPWQVR